MISLDQPGNQELQNTRVFLLAKLIEYCFGKISYPVQKVPWNWEICFTKGGVDSFMVPEP